MGATGLRASLVRTYSSFNPRARDGRDASAALRGSISSGVSIHAPVMGATPASLRIVRQGFVFQSTRP